MTYTIRPASARDEAQLHDLLPRLADFEVPHSRQPKELWSGDAYLLKKVLRGSAENTQLLVAADPSDKAVAVAMYTLKAELLSGQKSVHLETLVVHENHLRNGLGRKLINAVTTEAKKSGALSMSLHVFAKNTRARELYKDCGFDEELIRCFKPLP